MKWQGMIAEAYKDMFREMAKVLDGLSIDELHKRPFIAANPIGWLCWHCIRSCDRLLGDVVLGKQMWISAGWNRKFGRPPDPNDTGHGHALPAVDALYIPSAEGLVEYANAVKTPLVEYIKKLTSAELNRECPSSLTPGFDKPVSSRIMEVLCHNMQHIGQAGYVRGILRGHGWYGR